MDKRKQIKSFLVDINNENFSKAHSTLKKILFEKTKKRCKDAYDNVCREANNK